MNPRGELRKVSFEDSLGADVVNVGKCLGCGTCTAICPFGCLEYSEEMPRLVKECKACGICAVICPNYEFPIEEMEKLVFGRRRAENEDFGIYRRLIIARSSDSRVARACQDGGVVTGLLQSALEKDLIDGAVVSAVSADEPLFPIPKLAVTTDEILECAGTRYFYSPSIFALAAAVGQKKTRLAFVGTPCQIRAARRIQAAGLKKYALPVKYIVGLMCSECFTYADLVNGHIRGILGVNPRDIQKVNIKGKMIITTGNGTHTISLADARNYARRACQTCVDFSSELADISLGGLGLDGWTFTIVRTEKGEEMLSNAERAEAIEVRDVVDAENSLNLLVKLSKRKRYKSS